MWITQSIGLLIATIIAVLIGITVIGISVKELLSGLMKIADFIRIMGAILAIIIIIVAISFIKC